MQFADRGDGTAAAARSKTLVEGLETQDSSTKYGDNDSLESAGRPAKYVQERRLPRADPIARNSWKFYLADLYDLQIQQ